MEIAYPLTHDGIAKNAAQTHHSAVGPRATLRKRSMEHDTTKGTRTRKPENTPKQGDGWADVALFGRKCAAAR